MSIELNRRIHPRSLTDERAEVVFADTRLGCVVRDRSTGGARLVLRRRAELPAHFDVATRTALLRAELVWFDGVQAGVRFETELS